MKLEQLQKEHDRITDLYYNKQSISKEVFDKMHAINALKKQRIMPKDLIHGKITDEEIDNRIAELED